MLRVPDGSEAAPATAPAPYPHPHPPTHITTTTTRALGRLIYIHGYSTKGPEGRMVGGLISHLGDLPLLLMSCYIGGKALMQLM